MVMISIGYNHIFILKNDTYRVILELRTLFGVKSTNKIYTVSEFLQRHYRKRHEFIIYSYRSCISKNQHNLISKFISLL